MSEEYLYSLEIRKCFQWMSRHQLSLEHEPHNKYGDHNVSQQWNYW